MRSRLFFECPQMLVYFLLLVFFTVNRKSSWTNIFSQYMIYMFCLYHFSVKCILNFFITTMRSPQFTLTKKNLTFCCFLVLDPLKGILVWYFLFVYDLTTRDHVAHRYTYAPPRCRTLLYSRTFIPFSVSLWNDLANPVFDGVGLVGFKSRANASL